MQPLTSTTKHMGRIFSCLSKLDRLAFYKIRLVCMALLAPAVRYHNCTIWQEHHFPLMVIQTAMYSHPSDKCLIIVDASSEPKLFLEALKRVKWIYISLNVVFDSIEEFPVQISVSLWCHQPIHVVSRLNNHV